MNNGQVIQMYNEDEMHKAFASRYYRKTIGNALAQAYKGIPWRVDVSMDGGIATISSPLIDPKHRWGMVVHLSNDRSTLVRKVQHLGGELLERFNVNRTTGMADHLNRKISGEALGLAKGEQ